jgi:predicted DNA-binding protein
MWYVSSSIKCSFYKVRKIEDLLFPTLLLKRWQQTRAPTDTTRLNNISQRLRREIQEIKNELINAYLRELTDGGNTDYSLWKATKRLKDR